MKIIHLPQNKLNPYFETLARLISEKQGFQVDAHTGYLSIKQAIGGKRYDLIHVHFIPGSQSILKFLWYLSRILLYKALGSKILKTCHNIRPHSHHKSSGNYYAERIFAKITDHMLFFTEGQYAEFCEYYKYTPKNKSIIPHPYYGIYPNKIPRNRARALLGFTNDNFVFLIFGSVLKFKNYDRAIKDFFTICSKNDRLIAAISPHLVSEIEKKAFDDCQQLLQERTTDKYKCVSDLRFLDNDKLQDYFNAADVILFPFTDNTSSGSFMLTLDFEIPFIAISNNFNKNILNEKCGIFIENIDELQGAMKHIKTCDLDVMRTEITKIKPTFSWSRIIEQHLRAYKKCLGACRSET